MYLLAVYLVVSLLVGSWVLCLTFSDFGLILLCIMIVVLLPSRLDGFGLLWVVGWCCLVLSWFGLIDLLFV